MELIAALALAVLTLTVAVAVLARRERAARAQLARAREGATTAYATGYADGTEHGRQREAREQQGARRDRTRRTLDRHVGLN